MDALLNKIMQNIRAGGLTITYPDGHTQMYGDPTKAAKLHIKFLTSSAIGKTIRNNSVGFGEGYMNGEIIFETGFFDELMQIMQDNKRHFRAWLGSPAARAIAKIGKAKNDITSQKGNISHHYDIGNDFYKLWLDKSMTYSCGYFESPNTTLEHAQQQKREHILRKLNLNKGMSLLDIGSGWGSLLIMAAKEYGVNGLGVTLSDEQLKHSRQAAKDAGVDKQIKFELANYQDLPDRGKQYDRIVSVGMFEHVGRAQHYKYFNVVDKLLAEGGVTVLHTISCNNYLGGTNAWMDKYIFPGGYIPSVKEVVDLLPKYGFNMVDFESLRLHYALTLDEWRRRFEHHAAQVKKDYGEKFYRMWDMYLAACAANFRAGGIDLAQYILVKGHTNSLPLTRNYQCPK